MSKGDAARNCLSEEFRDNYNKIDWGRKRPAKPNKK